MLYKIPKAILDLVSKLSCETFCFLVRIYSLINVKPINFDRRKSIFIKNVSDWTHDIDNIIKELERNQICSVRRMAEKYILVTNIKPKLCVEIVRKKESDLLAGYIDSVSKRFSSHLQDRVKILLEGVLEFQLKCDKKPNKDIHYVSMELLKAPDAAIAITCDAYNANYRGTRSAQYIIGMLKRNRASYIERTEREDISYYKEELEKSEKVIAEQIANGTILIKNKISYDAMIMQKRFRKLNNLYCMGINILKQQNREKEIKTDYEWL